MTERRVALYFVASPLQYLAARRIADDAERGARQVLVWYKRGVAPIVREADWDAAGYMPWPRWEPLPGPFGRLRRLAANIGAVAALAGPCDRLHIHSAVFDTEAINYFLRALPVRLGARTMRARILPDGVISTRRYPLNALKRAVQCLRKLRRLVVPELDYWCFGGDRIGSDAPFCDRIYVLRGLPHEYPPARVVVLPPLVEAASDGDGEAAAAAGAVAGVAAARWAGAVDASAAHGAAGAASAAAGGLAPRALVIGQPLVGAGLMRAADRDAVGAQMREWLVREGIAEVVYKPHPKDPEHELREPGDQVLELDEPLEAHMSRVRYAAVVGVRSSALLFARQIYGPRTRVAAFGWGRVRFKDRNERSAMHDAFVACGVELND